MRERIPITWPNTPRKSSHSNRIDLWAALRRVLGRDFRIEAAALSRECATATLRIDNHNTGVATIEEKNDLSCVADKSIVVSRTVETRTLDSFEFADVSMIKVDVEGHEEAVIQGARETIKRNRPVLIIESEDRHNTGAPRRLANAFSELGYLVFYVKDRRLMEFGTLRDEDLDPANLPKKRSGVYQQFHLHSRRAESNREPSSGILVEFAIGVNLWFWSQQDQIGRYRE